MAESASSQNSGAPNIDNDTCLAFWAIPGLHDKKFISANPCWSGAHVALTKFHRYGQEETQRLLQEPLHFNHCSEEPWHLSTRNSRLLDTKTKAGDENIAIGSKKGASPTINHYVNQLLSLGAKSPIESPMGHLVRIDHCSCPDEKECGAHFYNS
jgi:hypothetical protein